MDHTEHRLSYHLSSPIDTPMNAKSNMSPCSPQPFCHLGYAGLAIFTPIYFNLFFPLSGSTIKTGKSLYNTNFFVLFPVLTVEEVPLGHWDIYQCLFFVFMDEWRLALSWQSAVMMSISLPSYLPKSRNHLQLLYSHEWKAKWSPQTPALTSLSHWVTANRNFILLVLSWSEQNKLSFKQPP